MEVVIPGYPQDPPGFHEVHATGPPVQESTPERKCPPERRGNSGGFRERLGDHEHRQREKQTERRDLAEVVDGNRPVPDVGQHDTQGQQHDIPAGDDRQQPPRHDAGDGQADQRREDEQPVRGGVEQLAEPGHLPEPAGEQPVEVVRDAGEHEGDQSEDSLALEQKHEKDGDQREPHQAEEVGNRDDSRTHLVPHLRAHSGRV